jgi:hypothetical protein
VSGPAVTITIPADTAEWLRGVVDNARVWAERRRHDLGGDQRTQSAAWSAGAEATHAITVLNHLPAKPAKEDAA